MQSFVTGGTGLIGRHLVARLLERGERVTVLIRPGSRTRRASVLRHWEATGRGELILVEGDLTGADLQLPADLDHVYHLAALYDLGAAAEPLERVNVEGTRRLLAALEVAGFSGVLHHVSSGKYDETQAMTPEAAAGWIIDGVTRRERRLMTGETARRWALNGLAPKGITRILNLVYRPYADDEKAYPELAPDRAILKRLIPGRLI